MMEQEILLKVIFEFYAYICLLVFFIGVIYKIITSLLNMSTSPKIDNSIARSINIGVVTLVFLHFAGYFVARELFLLIGLSSNLQTKLANMISGIIVTFFLTYIVIVICKKYFKQHMSFKGSVGEKIMSLIIILHIFLGFLAIGATTGTEDKALKSLSFNNYFTAFFSFKDNPSQYLKDLKWLTLGHLILGYSLLAILPFTRVIDILMEKVKQLLLFFTKSLRKNESSETSNSTTSNQID